MSKSVGIVAEYNPFHTGHRYQIDFLKKKGFSNIVISMSGSCVQRGEFAFMDKFTRAEMALRNGADVVAEIPYPFSCRSAEGYAKAGMQTLKAMGVDAVSFGSESGDIHLLTSIAEYLLSNEYETSLKGYLAGNIPFATAREKAIFDRFDISKAVVSASNDILAIEYIKACMQLDWHPEIVPVKRIGAGYNQISEKDGYSSASGIRKMVSEFRQDIAEKYIPNESMDIFIRNLDRGSYFLPDTAYEKAVLFTLRKKNAADFAALPDCNKELANSFEKSVAAAHSLDSLFDALPTKRYTRARLNRIILACMLDLQPDIPENIQYVRILGFNKKSEELIRNISKNCPLPVSHSAKIISEKSELCKKIIMAESAACDAQAVFCKISQSPRLDFTSRIVKV